MSKSKKKVTARATKESKLRRIVEALVERKLKSMGFLKEEKTKEMAHEEATKEGPDVQKPSDPKDKATGDTLVKKDVNSQGESLKKIPGQTGAARVNTTSAGLEGGEMNITLDEFKGFLEGKEEDEEEEVKEEGCKKTKRWS